MANSVHLSVEKGRSLQAVGEKAAGETLIPKRPGVGLRRRHFGGL
jgi:hypothetical protein